MGMILLSYPFFVSLWEGCLEVVNGVSFGVVLGLYSVEIAVLYKRYSDALSGF